MRRIPGGALAASGAALLIAGIAAPPAASAGARPRPHVVIGSKAFPESWVLGEALRLLAEGAGARAEHRQALGGTEIVYAALRQGSIDVYPEYTGTIAEVLLKAPGRLSLAAMRRALAPQGIGISDPLGFNNGYALAVTAATQRRYGLRTLSDLARHPELRLGFTHEFIGRKDGWTGLARHYGLSHRHVRGIQHQLAYSALTEGRIDVMEIYTTDAKILKLNLRLLEDDRHFFPRYDAVLLYRLELAQRAPHAWAAMQRLAGRIDEAQMIRANAHVELEGRSATAAAASLLRETLDEAGGGPLRRDSTPGAAATGLPPEVGRILGKTAEHLHLVLLSLLAATALGIPLGVVATRSRPLARATLAVAGLLQTIPSLALLAFLIPLLGIGAVPALVALFLYGLLPIVRNTYTGLTTLPPPLVEAAEALGLPPGAQLRRIYLPLAAPAILAGIQTSAVINVGTATLAAFIGAGGLGDPIKIGLELQRTDLLLQGAVPAALLAIGIQWAFEGLERWLVPRGLRI